MPTAQELARTLTGTANVTFADAHASGQNDDATARKNIEDTAAGRRAKRSSYGSAPGGDVMLGADLLAGLVALAQTYRFTVSELAGGEHGASSRHYVGVAADVNVIDGRRVDATHPGWKAFADRGAALGATETLGPGDPGHRTHVHLAWPRPHVT